MKTVSSDIMSVIEKETGYRYNMIDLAFSNIEDKLANLGTFDEDENEVIMTPKEHKQEAKLKQQLKDKIDKVFLKITKMLKKKHNIEIEAPTHNDFGYLEETEMGDFMDIILESIELVEN